MKSNLEPWKLLKWGDLAADQKNVFKLRNILLDSDGLVLTVRANIFEYINELRGSIER